MPTALVKGLNVLVLNARTGTGDSNVFAIPPNVEALSWQLSYDVAPAAISVTLRTSLDNVSYTILDTSTAVGGELRTKSLSGERFLKLNVGTNTGDRAVTVYVSLR